MEAQELRVTFMENEAASFQDERKINSSMKEELERKTGRREH